MVSVVDLILLGVVLIVHTLLTAVLTRFFRIRLQTRWGSAIYALLLIPPILLVTTLLFTGLLNIGFNLGNEVTAIAVMIALPFILGVTIDVLYVPPPDEYELPETSD